MSSPEPIEPIGEGFALDGELSPAESTAVALLAAYLAAKATEIAAVPAAATTRAAWTAARALKAATAIAGRLLASLLRLGLDRRAVRAVAAMTFTVTFRAGPGGADGVAARLTARQEHQWRAAYIVAAARRVTAALRPPARQPLGTPAGPAWDAKQRLQDALARERRYLRQHLDAGKARQRAAREADRVADGALRLRWKTVLDRRTTPDCRALDGRVFLVGAPPGGTYPGAVHPQCRCRAVPA